MLLGGVEGIMENVELLITLGDVADSRAGFLDEFIIDMVLCEEPFFGVEKASMPGDVGEWMLLVDMRFALYGL